MVRVPAAKKDADVLLHLLQGLDEFDAVLVGQDHVAENHVEFSVLPGEQVLGLLRVLRDAQRVPALDQGLAHEFAHVFLVLDQEDPFVLAVQVGHRHLRLELGFLLLLLRGKVDLERGAVSRFAVHVDPAAVLLNDAVDHRQAQAGSLARTLRAEERFENPLDGFGVHAGARVGDRETDEFPGPRLGYRLAVSLVDLHVFRADRKLAPVRHGVARVDRQVHDDLLDRHPVRADRPQVGMERRADADVLADEAVQQFQKVFEDLVQRDDNEIPSAGSG